ncbi:MAG: hypothetical protein JXJ04_10880 [Spirochaetales bacterium]|nr:hypothetical protein [Spirochaetales bacterium]
MNTFSNPNHYDTNTRLKNILTANPTKEILNQIYEYDLANNISRQNEKTYAYDKTNQLTRCTTQGSVPEERPTPGYYGCKQGDTAGTTTLDFNVGANAIIHLDYNPTSIGMDFGNGPRRIRKIVLTPDADHTNYFSCCNPTRLHLLYTSE